QNVFIQKFSQILDKIPNKAIIPLISTNMKLNLPPFDVKLSQKDGRTTIYDFLRKRFVCLTPEEWVRQHFTHYLVAQKHYPAALLANE
ncbi:type I restriction enzyme HsdR N-terminal domain-containing protein, partial [Acinetobacter baumannii]|nr:type I restriction enzyme HsdR N-terminal domain-containing protein [Acinetobacter baumannii]